MQSNLLRAKMVEKGVNQKKLAQMIGMSENSLCRKLSGKRQFTVCEASLIVDALDISNAEEIFLR